MTEALCEVAAQLFYIPLRLLVLVGDVAANATGDGTDAVVAEIQGKLEGVVKGIQSTCMGVGIAICMLFFIMAFVDLVTSDRLTMELMIKSFAKLIAGVFFINQSPTIYKYVIKFGTAFATMIAETPIKFKSKIDVQNYDALRDAFIKHCDGNAGSAIALLGASILCAAVPVLLALLLIVVTYVVVFQRLIELNLRGALMPIGFALMSEDGFKGPGARYFKKFLAVTCQGAGLVLIGKITTGCIMIAASNMIKGMVDKEATDIVGIMTPLLGNEAVILGVAVAAVAAMFKSNAIMNDVFGV